VSASIAFHSAAMIVVYSVSFLSGYWTFSTSRRSLVNRKYADRFRFGAFGSFGAFLDILGRDDMLSVGIIKVIWKWGEWSWIEMEMS